MRQNLSLPPLPLAVWVIAFSMIWSSAFIVGEIGLQYSDPFTLLTARFLLVAVLLLPICLASTRKRDLGNPVLIRDATLLGTLNNAVYLGFTFMSLHFISPELVVVVVSCAPFLTVVVTGIAGFEAIGMRRLLGIAIGFSGVLLITLSRPVGTAGTLGLALAFLGTASFAGATVLYRGRAMKHAPQHVNFWQSIIAALVLLPVAVTQNLSSEVTAHPLPFAAVVTYLAVVVTICGMWMWLYLIRRTGPTTASTYHLANPVCGLLLSHWVLGTGVRLTDWIGVAVIVLGLSVVTIAAKGDRHGSL